MGDNKHTPPVARMRAQSAMMLGHPVIVLVQPETVGYLGKSGELLSADTVETSVKASGAQTLTLPPDFGGAPAEGWQGRLTLSTDAMLLRFPSGHALYDGTMPTTPDWVSEVRKAGSVVVLTGPMATLADFEPLIAQGRVLWTCVPFTVDE